MFSNTNNCEYLNRRKDGGDPGENNPMETILREFDREDVVAKLERECEALEDMEKKYQEELKEKKYQEELKEKKREEEEKKATFCVSIVHGAQRTTVSIQATQYESVFLLSSSYLI